MVSSVAKHGIEYEERKRGHDQGDGKYRKSVELHTLSIGRPWGFVDTAITRCCWTGNMDFDTDSLAGGACSGSQLTIISST